MKTKHTPGPWKASTVKGFENDLVYCRIMSDAKPIGFAGVYKEKYRVTGEEAQWNAKLIAAAPEMLEALQAVAKVAAELRMDSMTFKWVNNAIKKATS